MLDPNPLLELVQTSTSTGSASPWLKAYRSRGIVTQVATEAWQLRDYHRLRDQVFVDEQGLFSSSDVDAVDPSSLPIVAMSGNCGMPHEVIGTVRIYRQMGNTWYGGRLAVLHRYRRHGVVGESLIRAAVCTAHALGCREFLATVQPQVVRYFERHHFETRGSVEVCGHRHALMEADLAHYPPVHFGQQHDVLWADCAARLTARSRSELAA